MPIFRVVAHTSLTSRVRALAERVRPADAGGFVLIEVIVSALMVALTSMLLIGIITAGNTSADQKKRSQADSLAQQDQERLRGMSLEQLANLDQTSPRSVALDGTTFSISSTGRYLARGSGNSACTSTGSETADYVAIKSDVTWSGNSRTHVIEQSVVSPPSGSSLLTRVTDQNGAALSGTRVTAVPSSSSTNASAAATTDASGCTIFSAMPPGDYTVTATKSGFVNKDGDTAPTFAATATSGGTTTAPFTIGQAGALTATFKTTISGTTYTNQLAPSISWVNPQMATFGTYSPHGSPNSITTPATLFPFFTTSPGIYTKNYTVFAGSCAVNQPTANVATATVPPGGTGTTQQLLPPVILKVSFRSFSSTTLVQPDHIVVYNGCSSSFSQFDQWDEPVRGTGSAGSTDATGALGALSFPGLPYGPYYQVCVDNNGYRFTSGTLTNTNFSGTTWNVTIDSRSFYNRGTC